MASYVKFQNFVEDLGAGVHDLRAAGDTVRVYLSNTAPNVATHTVKADIAEIAGGNGYTLGGEDVQNTYTETGGTATLDGTNIVWTASGGSFGPFRYAIMYNDTPTSPADPLIAYWDYGSSITVNDGETFTFNITTNLFTLS